MVTVLIYKIHWQWCKYDICLKYFHTVLFLAYIHYMYLGNTKMIVVKVSCTPFVYCCTCINFVSTDNTDFLKSLVELRLENVKKTFVTSVNL